MSFRLAGATALTSLALLATSSVSVAHAQASEEKAIMIVINHMFDGMRNRDTALMRSTLLPGTVLERVDTSGLGKPIPMSDFIARVGQGSGPGGNEQIKDPKILVDGPLASVWTYYTYTPGGQTTVNHCGTDTFLLRKSTDGWKIFHIADSSHSTNCTPIK
jgi:hypothetical protein